jgi:hypothetical protein
MPAKTKTPEAPYFKFIQDCIVADASRKGTSRQAIKKYVMTNRTEFQSGTFSRVLKTSTEAGKLIAVKGCFKLGTAPFLRTSSLQEDFQCKKAAVKNHAAKKPAAKKSVAKKKAVTKDNQPASPWKAYGGGRTIETVEIEKLRLEEIALRGEIQLLKEKLRLEENRSLVC